MYTYIPVHFYYLFFPGKTHKFISTQWGFNSSSGHNVATLTEIICLLSGPA